MSNPGFPSEEQGGYDPIPTHPEPLSPNHITTHPDSEDDDPLREHDDTADDEDPD
ncbi:hypothetical protein J2X66_004116 [Pseudomonas sp. 3296]|uniref:hypothetical protein n=1 Tax=Pseudomonas sp. 3296 TaxID=2817753 RepID=UPI002859E8D8|nr:hypothetical protein [Pseudomonas sp. 3296]MDR6917237.1 hypothetical protein [Pseudomonas sp. 3296]